MKRFLVLLLTFGIFAGAAYAHNGMKHVMGTVTAISHTSVTVKGTDGRTQTVALTGETKYRKSTAAMSLTDVKVGDHIVVHVAMKGTQLTAAEVMLGAMKMQGMSGDMSGMKMDHPAPRPH